MTSTTPAAKAPIGPIDLVLLGLAVIVALAVAVSPFTIGAMFAGMYADFGGPLPMSTRLAISSWAAPSLGGTLVTVALASLAIPGAGPRRGALVLVTGLAAASAALLLVSYYQPIFALSAAVVAE